MKCLLSVVLSATCFSCSPYVTRDEVTVMAHRYTQVKWMPEQRHVAHGPDAMGVVIHTPDRTISKFGDSRGWWEPGVLATSMPYQWGGFDTPETFLKNLKRGKKAGDVGGAAKRRLGDLGVSVEACGIDCSGFVSRCWKLTRPFSTRELHQVSDPLASWSDLRAGDILLNEGHVVLFVKWTVPGKELAAYEAGPFPAWKVSACGLDADKLKRQGYAPWRYRWIVDGR